MKTYRLGVLGLLFLALLCWGCNDEDDDDNGTNSNLGKPTAEMVNKWTFTSVTVNGSPATLDSALEWHADVVGANVFIEATSSYVYEEVDSNGAQLFYEVGWIYVDGNEIDINVLTDSDGPVNETSRVGFTLVADTLTLTEVLGGNTTVLRLLRQ